jgi:hypothetical protein
MSKQWLFNFVSIALESFLDVFMITEAEKYPAKRVVYCLLAEVPIDDTNCIVR